MKLKLLRPKELRPIAYFNAKVEEQKVADFKADLQAFFGSCDPKQPESHLAMALSGFLTRLPSIQQKYYVNARDNKDLVIHTGPMHSDPVGVILEL